MCLPYLPYLPRSSAYDATNVDLAFETSLIEIYRIVRKRRPHVHAREAGPVPTLAWRQLQHPPRHPPRPPRPASRPASRLAGLSSKSEMTHVDLGSASSRTTLWARLWPWRCGWAAVW